MGYTSTTGVIIYWKPDQIFFIHRAHNFWFGEYNSRLSIEYKHTTGSLILRQYHEVHIHNSDLLNLIPCELYITSTLFSDTTSITYEIQLPPSGNKVGFNLLDDEDFTIPYITDTIPNLPAGHKLLSQAYRNMCIVAINGEEPTTSQGLLDELNRHKYPHGKSKINISICKRKSYQRTDFEDICYRFYQVRPVVSHLESRIPKKPPTPKDIGEGLKGPQI